MSDGQLHDGEAATVASRDGVLLDAAVGVFARYGYRKTSMDEVARAAGVSRQCLYTHFATKEELFRRAVTHKLDGHYRAAAVALADARRPLAARLTAGCEEWVGRYVGWLGADDQAELMCASSSLAGAALAQFQRLFEAALTDCIAASPLEAACRAQGASAAELARALHATARGLKQLSASRQDFERGIALAVGLLCQSVAAR